MSEYLRLNQEAVRDLIREASQIIEVADVTGSPRIEIDYAADLVRAAREALPRLQPPLLR